MHTQSLCWPAYRDQHLGFYEKFQPVSEMRKGRGRAVSRRNKVNMAKREATTFAPIIALATLHSCITVVK